MKLIEKFNIKILIEAIKLMGKRNKAFLISILLFNILEAIGVPLVAYGMKGVINAVTASDITMFWSSIRLIAIQIVLWAIYSPISSYLCSWASKRAICNIKADLVAHILELDQRYHDSKAKGELLSLMSNDVGALESIYDWDYFQVIRTAVVGVSGLVTMIIIDWRFAVIVLLLGIASVYTTAFFSERISKIGVKLSQQLSANSTGFYELIKGAKTIRLLGVGTQRVEKLYKEIGNEAEMRIKITKSDGKMNTLTTLINSLSYILILIIGGIFVYLGLSDWGIVISLLGLKGTSDCLFSECGMRMANIQKNLAGVKRLLIVMSQKSEKLDTSKYKFSSNLQNSNTVLSLEDVGFSYDGTNDVLKSIDMSLEKGKLTVLIGESGSGKSTLMKILMSLHQPTKGKVIFKNDEVEDITSENLRNKIAYVSQESMLFNGSIYDNISFGRERATKEDVIAAARLAEADGFISQMTDGYDTQMIDDGKSLSGGQRQRIAISRALVKNATILLLDEITSALDSKNEERIFETIDNLKKDKAILLITHKRDIAKYADRVYHIKNGILS